jgi:hypothetical protein
MISGWLNDIQNDDEDDENLEEIDNEDEELDTEAELYLFNKIKALIRKDSLSKFDKNIKLTKRDKELKLKLEKAIALDSLIDNEKIGQLAFFIK